MFEHFDLELVSRGQSVSYKIIVDLGDKTYSTLMDS